MDLLLINMCICIYLTTDEHQIMNDLTTRYSNSKGGLDRDTLEKLIHAIGSYSTMRNFIKYNV